MFGRFDRVVGRFAPFPNVMSRSLWNLLSQGRLVPRAHLFLVIFLVIRHLVSDCTGPFIFVAYQEGVVIERGFPVVGGGEAINIGSKQ